jgi:predicted transcriptional regulator
LLSAKNVDLKRMEKMLKPTETNQLIRQQLPSEVSASELLSMFEAVFRNDVRFRVIVILSNREAACLREIARNAGISHKNLVKYLDTLTHKGIVETYPVGIRSKVYKLASKYDYLRFFFNSNHFC